jgi:hypothetical protein
MRTFARTLAILVALSVTLPAAAFCAGAISSVEGMTSTVFQHRQSSFSGIGLRVQIHPAQLIESVTLMPTLEYWRNTSNISSFGIESTRRDATLGIDARYDFPHQGLRPYMGAGMALHFMSNRVDAPSLGLNDATNSLIKGGLTLLGGVTFGITGKLSNLIELKYHHVPDQSQLKINWGLSYGL